MPKVLFTDSAELKQGDGKGPKYEKGHVYDLSGDQAGRWKRRNVAKDVPADTPLGLYDPEWKAKLKPKEVPKVEAKVEAKVDTAKVEDEPEKAPRHHARR